MTRNELLLEQWKVASQLHRHEDDLAYKKLQYFATIHGILVSALGIGLSRVQAAEFKVGASAICFFGVLTSVIWFLIHKRGQMFHKFRVAQAAKAERDLEIDGSQVLTVYSATLEQTEKIGRFYSKYSIHDLIGVLAVFLFLAWLLGLVYFALRS